MAFQLACGTLIPFCIIVVSNIWIIITVRKANEERKKMEVIKEEGKKKREKDTKYLSRMLILVCIAYVTSSIPYRMYDALMNLPELMSLYDFTKVYWILRYQIEYWWLLVLWHQNYSINFFLYCIGGGRKYRNDVKALFRDIRGMVERKTQPSSGPSRRQ